MADPYAFLKEETAPRKNVPVTSLFPTDNVWKKPERAPEPPREPTLADDNSFLQNAAIGGVETARELGTGAELWGRRLGGDPNLQSALAEEKQRRELYRPVMDTWGGKIGSAVPAAAFGALTPPSGLAAYATNAALSMAPTLDPAEAVLSGALSVPGTLIGNTLASGAARGTNAVLGRTDPLKENTVRADRVLREAGDKGLPITAFVTPAERATRYDAAIMQNHPVAVLDRLKDAADATNKALWQKVDDIASANKSIISIDPTNTLKALDNFRRNYGTSHLTDLSNPRDSAALLYMMGNEKAARNTLSRTLTDAENANPAVADQFFKNVQQGMTGASFDQMRALQQRIGNAIGELSGKPDADRKMLAGLRNAYSAALTDMEDTGNKTVDKQLKEALQAASKQHREEVLPFRTGEINGARNPILRKYMNGTYQNDPSQILADLNTASGRAGFANFVYPKLQPEEAAVVQKIIAEPKLTRELRGGLTPEGGFHPVEKLGKIAADADVVRYNPFLKRILAADPSVLENSPMRPVTRAAIGALRQAASGERAAAALQGGARLAGEAVSPLTNLFQEKQTAYVPDH